MASTIARIHQGGFVEDMKRPYSGFFMAFRIIYIHEKAPSTTMFDPVMYGQASEARNV